MKKEKKQGKLTFSQKVKLEIREDKKSFIVFTVLNVLVITSLIRQFFNGHYESVFLCILTLFLLVLPAAMEVSFKMEIPPTLNIIIMLFIFSAEILGEINSFYTIIPMWDTILHTLNGFLAAAIGCSLIVLLNNNERIVFDLSPIFVAIVGFCFSMTIGVLWEFFEYFMDVYFGLDMQKDTIINTISSVSLDPNGLNNVVTIDNITETTINGEELALGGYLEIGLHDTMKDMIVNFVGAVVFSVLGYYYAKTQGEGKFAKSFMPTKSKKNYDKD